MAISEGPATPQPGVQSGSDARATQAAPPRRRWGRRVFLVVLLLLFAALLILGVRLGLPAWRGYQAAQELRTLAGGELTSESAPALADALTRADAAYGDLVAGVAPFNPILHRMGFVPQYGGTIAAAPELMAMGRELSAMVAEVAPALGPALNAEGGMAKGVALINTLAAEPDRLERLAQHAEAINQIVPTIPLEGLDPRIAGALIEAGPLLPLLPDMIRALPGVPALIGAESPRTYLVLVQNNHELRPTGGFITAIGRLTLDQGEVAELDFGDSYSVFKRDTLYPPAPAPMEEYMGIPYLVFRDANWSPDLPTTSNVAKALYTVDTGLDYQDTVTVDLFAVQRLIDALGPLQLEGVDEPLTGENVLEIVKEMWARPPDTDADVSEDIKVWWRERKNFIPLVAQAALSRVMNGEADYGSLAAAAITALDNREIQVVTSVPAVSEMLANRHWDGALVPPASGDFLALVDTNMGYNKANAAIQRELSYVVTPPAAAGELATATLTITYTHPIDADDPGCDQSPRYGTSYDDMIARCFFNYVRVYAPLGSEMLSMTGVYPNTVLAQRGEKRTEQFAGYFILPPRNSNTVTLTYSLPQHISDDLAAGNYTLRLQRQSGSGALPLTIQVGDQTLPTTLEEGVLDWRKP